MFRLDKLCCHDRILATENFCMARDIVHQIPVPNFPSTEMKEKRQKKISHRIKPGKIILDLLKYYGMFGW